MALYKTIELGETLEKKIWAMVSKLTSNRGDQTCFWCYTDDLKPMFYWLSRKVRPERWWLLAKVVVELMSIWLAKFRQLILRKRSFCCQSLFLSLEQHSGKITCATKPHCKVFASTTYPALGWNKSCSNSWWQRFLLHVLPLQKSLPALAILAIQATQTLLHFHQCRWY